VYTKIAKLAPNQLQEIGKLIGAAPVKVDTVPVLLRVGTAPLVSRVGFIEPPFPPN
jgi:hypothetical protein